MMIMISLFYKIKRKEERGVGGAKKKKAAESGKRGERWLCAARCVGE